MTEAQLITKLHELHETRKSMSFSSLYHGVYEKEAIELNAQLFAISGKNYVDYTDKDKEIAFTEAILLSGEV